MNTESPFYSEDELKALGATAVGKKVQVSRLARFYGFKGVIGDFSRIDDFAILKGVVDIGRHVHVSAYCLLSGVGGRIIFEDYSGMASHCAAFTSTDDYSGPFLTNPTVPREHTSPITGNIIFEKGSLLGAHSVALPGTVMRAFSTVGAMCIMKGEVAEGDVMVSGMAPRTVRKRDVAALEAHARAVEEKDKLLP